MNAKERRADRRRNEMLLKKIKTLLININKLQGRIAFFEDMPWWMKLRRVFE